MATSYLSPLSSVSPPPLLHTLLAVLLLATALDLLPPVSAVASTSRPSDAARLPACFQIPLPGGRSVSYDAETGVLRIDVGGSKKKFGADTADRPAVPPPEALPTDETLGRIEVKDTGTPRGYGAFVKGGSGLPRYSFLGFYEGEMVRTRDELDRRAEERRRNTEGRRGGGGSMDYVMSVDGGLTFLDGYERATDRSKFSPVHLNHEDGDKEGCNCFRLLEGMRVAFFTSRPVEGGEELCFDYGENFWRGRENEKI